MSPNDESARVRARAKAFIQAYCDLDVDRLMSFMDPTDFTYSDFGSGIEKIGFAKLKELLVDTFEDCHGLKTRTTSLHNTKDFTAWEYTATLRSSRLGDGSKVHKKHAHKLKVRGCALLWWNGEGKVVKNHSYGQLRDPEDHEDGDEYPE